MIHPTSSGLGINRAWPRRALAQTSAPIGAVWRCGQITIRQLGGAEAGGGGCRTDLVSLLGGPPPGLSAR